MSADEDSKRNDSDDSESTDSSTSISTSPYFVSLAGQLGLGGITGYSVEPLSRFGASMDDTELQVMIRTPLHQVNLHIFFIAYPIK